MKYVFVGLVGFLFSLNILSCGKKKDEKHYYDQASYSNIPVYPTTGTASRSGTLTLIPDELGLQGLVTYTIDDSGVLVYKGYVSYCSGFLTDMNSLCNALTQTFEGTYKADPKTFLSNSYNGTDPYRDNKLIMQSSPRGSTIPTYDRDVDIRVVDQPYVFGRFELDTQSRLIDIRYAEVHGKIGNYPVTIRVQK